MSFDVRGGPHPYVDLVSSPMLIGVTPNAGPRAIRGMSDTVSSMSGAALVDPSEPQREAVITPLQD